MTNEERELARRNLLERRRALLARWKEELDAVGDTLETRAPAWADLDVLPRDAQVLAQMVDAEARELGEIIVAMQRLAEGRYGICEHCDGTIESQRLGFLPETRVCVICAELAEARRV